MGYVCRHSHAGEAVGLKRGEIADDADDCLQYLKYGNCRRLEKDNSPLVHGGDVARSVPRTLIRLPNSR